MEIDVHMQQKLEAHLATVKWNVLREKPPTDEKMILVKDHEGNYSIGFKHSCGFPLIEVLCKWPMGFVVEWCEIELSPDCEYFVVASEKKSVFAIDDLHDSEIIKFNEENINENA